ncbi:coproporphyrinogen III oxidase, partial [Halomonas marinisediminis]
EMEKDALVEIFPNSIIVTDKGKPFVRNICMAFDLLLQRNQPESQLFSMTI